MASIWTNEKVDILKSAWTEGYSATQIGATLGITRNAALGKLHRLGLCKVKTIKKKPVERVRVYHRKVVTISRANGNSNRFRVIESIQSGPVKLRCVEVEPRHLSLMDLEPGNCRYPYGDGPMTFCGRPKREDSSYCPAHHFLSHAYTAPVLSREELLEKRREYTNAYRASKRAEAAA